MTTDTQKTLSLTDNETIINVSEHQKSTLIIEELEKKLDHESNNADHHLLRFKECYKQLTKANKRIECLEEKFAIACKMIDKYKRICKHYAFQLDKTYDQIEGLKWSLELERRRSSKSSEDRL